MQQARLRYYATRLTRVEHFTDSSKRTHRKSAPAKDYKPENISDSIAATNHAQKIEDLRYNKRIVVGNRNDAKRQVLFHRK